MRLGLDSSRPGRQAVGQPGIQGTGLAGDCRDVDRQVEHAGEKAQHLAAGGERRFGGRQDRLDRAAQVGTAGGIDNPCRVEAGAAWLPHRVVGAIEQGFDRGFGTLAELPQAGVDGVGAARHLRRHGAAAVAVGLRQAMLVFRQEAGLLLDQQHPARGRKDHEIDLAGDLVAVMDAGPVHPVQHGVGGRQALCQGVQGLPFALCVAAGRQRLPAVGNDGCHAADANLPAIGAAAADLVRPGATCVMMCRHAITAGGCAAPEPAMDH